MVQQFETEVEIGRKMIYLCNGTRHIRVNNTLSPEQWICVGIPVFLSLLVMRNEYKCLGLSDALNKESIQMVNYQEISQRDYDELIKINSELRITIIDHASFNHMVAGFERQKAKKNDTNNS